jgi:hypothetical protein
MVTEGAEACAAQAGRAKAQKIPARKNLRVDLEIREQGMKAPGEILLCGCFVGSRGFGGSRETCSEHNDNHYYLQRIFMRSLHTRKSPIIHGFAPFNECDLGVRPKPGDIK